MSEAVVTLNVTVDPEKCPGHYAVVRAMSEEVDRLRAELERVRDVQHHTMVDLDAITLAWEELGKGGGSVSKKKIREALEAACRDGDQP